MKAILTTTILALAAFAGTAATTKAPVAAHPTKHVLRAGDPYPICKACQKPEGTFAPKGARG